jgi:[acyl-carrier-protein] S-malonyltransferase
MVGGFVFPGQGSQSVGMLKDLAETYPAVRDTFAEASEALGYDLWALVQSGPAEVLDRTEKTQPALLAAGVAVWRVWTAKGGTRPARVAGHSLGEYTALVCAGALPFREAVTLCADRGRYMQEAVPPGTGKMAAILGLDDEAVARACRGVAIGEVVSCANFNAPGQIVIAGDTSAVEAAVLRARDLGARRTVMLPVSVPSHCALMRRAALRLQERLQTVRIETPAIPVVHSADVCSHGDPEEIARVLSEQLFQPVRWVEVIRRLCREGVDAVVECGPGRLLAGLCKRIEPGLRTFVTETPEDLENALGEMR